MSSYVALLRAVNVGGTGKLPMTELKSMCERAGFKQVRTYIASGNVVFASSLSEPNVKRALEKALTEYGGKAAQVLVRTAAEMREVLEKNPFPNAPSNNTVAIFLDEAPPAGILDTITGRADEQVVPAKREIYVHYGKVGMGRSKLRIPAAKPGTARNMNTVAKLAEMAAAIDTNK